MGRARRLVDVYRFPAFRPRATVRGVFGDPKVRIVRLERRGKKLCVEPVVGPRAGSTDRKLRQVRDLSAGDTRIYLELESRRVRCRSCGKVKQEKLAWLANNPFYTKRFAFFVGRRCRTSTIQDVARELHLDWKTVKELDKQYMQEQLRRAGTPGSAGDRHRRSLDPQGAHLPHRGQRPGAAAGRSGSAARTAPKRAWSSSTSGWEPRKASGSGWR